MHSDFESPLLTIDEAANYLRIGKTSLYRLINNGQIPTVRLLSRKQLIEQKVLDNFVLDSWDRKQDWSNDVD